MSILIDSQPLDTRSIDTAERDALIVSAVQVDGTWRVLSRYGDDIWDIRGAPTNKALSMSKLDFQRVPVQFRAVLKEVLYRFLRRGRFGEGPGTPTQTRRLFAHLVGFMRFLARTTIHQLASATPMVCAMFVHECQKHKGGKGKLIAPQSIHAKLSAVEALHDLSQHTNDPMASFPWPDDSAWRIAGMSGPNKDNRARAGKTPLIPDADFTALFQAAWSVVQKADELLSLREDLDEITADTSLTKNQCLYARQRHLRNNKWSGSLASFLVTINDIRTACYIVVASLSGCRNHELAFVHSGACYRTLDNDGEEFWWMRSISTKTGEGKTEWMIPPAAAEALRVMDRWAKPYQSELNDEIEQRRAANPADVEIAEAMRHSGAVFLGRSFKGGFNGGCQVRTLSDCSWGLALRTFARKNGITWRIATHQFRRKFANYAARSQFGDLRYLKEHFKHWSFDMTLGYAMNDHQEIALYSEVYDELADLKDGIVSGWMDSGEPLAGRLGSRMIEWRGGNEVTLFKDHKSMVRTLAEGFGNLRSNGHAWCTADQGIDCIGNGGLDRTRCVGCDHAVIGRVHAKVYQGLYDQLTQTLRHDDIGEGGRAYVQRSLDRCASVLKALGHEPTRGSEQ